MNRPFYLDGRYVKLFDHILVYKDKDSEQVTEYTFDYNDSYVEYLKRLGCSDFSLINADTSSLEWLEGIDVGEERSMEYAEKIFQMGESAYKKMIEEPTPQDYLLDLKFRLAMLELGV